MSDIPIEKGIPVPESRAGRIPVRYPWGKMEIGDSFFVASDNPERLQRTLTSAARGWVVRSQAAGRQFTVRRVDGGVRVWRTA